MGTALRAANSLKRVAIGQPKLLVTDNLMNCACVASKVNMFAKARGLLFIIVNAPRSVATLKSENSETMRLKLTSDADPSP